MFKKDLIKMLDSVPEDKRYSTLLDVASVLSTVILVFCKIHPDLAASLSLALFKDDLGEEEGQK